MQTESGRIAQLLQTVDCSRTPLQENLDRLGKRLGQAALAIVAMIVTIGLYRGQAFIDMLVFGIALAVAVVPEALPAVVTISLAIGVQRVVRALQEKGHVAAMTGDGVNDAPALKKADIGVAMGITGTDVAKDAAAMTLLDDNFASIVAAIEEGRGIFGNIKKYLAFVLSCNIGEIGLMAGTALAGLPLPLTAVQILYVNLATDGLIALALAVDPHEPELMRRRPRTPRSGVLGRPLIVLMVIGGLWSTAVNILLFA